MAGECHWACACVATAGHTAAWRGPLSERCATGRSSSIEQGRSAMKVWIDQSRCLNSRQCEKTAPRVFSIADDSLAYVRQNGRLLDQPGGETCQANVLAGGRTVPLGS
ncbi:ferredoxin [Streptomyces iranensis]|uniref:ferredoxin n=1 Tax=Streptomyces iranensis TaxID=576784 RepID=UPI0039B74EE0